MDAQLSVPPPRNEPVRGYAPGSPERASLQARLDAMKGERLDLTMTIGGKRVDGRAAPPSTWSSRTAGTRCWA